MSNPQFLIYGAGAIGGTIGSHLVREGYPVTFVDRDPAHVEALRTAGLSIVGPLSQFNVKVRAMAPAELSGTYGRVLLCVKAQDTRAALNQLVPHLRDDSYVVSVQNGLNERVLASVIGTQRTVGCFVNFDADYLSPGVVQYAGHGAVVVGELDGRLTERLELLHQGLCAFDQRAEMSSNVWGYLWSKLAYAALLFATALTNDSIADCLAAKRYQELFVSLAREVLEVAVAEGVECESFDGFAPAAFLGDKPGTDAAASLAALAGHNRGSAKSRSGIWRDLAVRKRRTEVDAQLGMVVDIARGHDLQMPVTERLIEMIHEVENGQRKQDMVSLDELAKEA